MRIYFNLPLDVVLEMVDLLFGAGIDVLNKALELVGVTLRAVLVNVIHLDEKYISRLFDNQLLVLKQKRSILSVVEAFGLILSLHRLT